MKHNPYFSDSLEYSTPPDSKDSLCGNYTDARNTQYAKYLYLGKYDHSDVDFDSGTDTDTDDEKVKTFEEIEKIKIKREVKNKLIKEFNSIILTKKYECLVIHFANLNKFNYNLKNNMGMFKTILINEHMLKYADNFKFFKYNIKVYNLMKYWVNYKTDHMYGQFYYDDKFIFEIRLI